MYLDGGKLKVVSLYSGADNLGDGLFQAGHEVILAVEYYPKDTKLSLDACETIKLNHPDTEVIHQPVSEVLQSLPKCDIIIGGPPCPEFSRANTNRTYDMCEVNNFWKAKEITKAKHHLMENVQDLGKFLKVKNYLINMADYGVPQTRLRRIFTDLKLPQTTHAEFPSATLFGEPTLPWVSVREVLGLGEGFIEDRKITFGADTYRKYSVEKPSNVIHTDSRQFYISSTGYSKSNRENKSRSIDLPSDTVVVANDLMITDYVVKSKKKIRNRNQSKGFERKLENEEYAILQGFRKDFEFYGGKNSVRRQIGNAVPSIIGKMFTESLQ